MFQLAEFLLNRFDRAADIGTQNEIQGLNLVGAFQAIEQILQGYVFDANAERRPTVQLRNAIRQWCAPGQCRPVHRNARQLPVQMSKPVRFTGILGPASSRRCSGWSVSYIALTRPKALAADDHVATRESAVLYDHLATTPRPASCWASRQVPERRARGDWLCIRAVPQSVSSVSSRSSTPSPVMALVLTTSTSPPHSLGSSSLAESLAWHD